MSLLTAGGQYVHVFTCVMPISFEEVKTSLKYTASKIRVFTIEDPIVGKGGVRNVYKCMDATKYGGGAAQTDSLTKRATSYSSCEYLLKVIKRP